MKSTENNNQTTTEPSKDHENTTAKIKADRRKRLRKRELKATKSVALVYMGFVICWLPTCIFQIVSHFNRPMVIDFIINNPKTMKFILYFFLRTLPLSHTMINPLIYSYSNKQFRNSLSSIYKKVIGGNLSLSFTTTNESHVSVTVRNSFGSRGSVMTYVSSEA